MRLILLMLRMDARRISRWERQNPPQLRYGEINWSVTLNVTLIAAGAVALSA